MPQYGTQDYQNAVLKQLSEGSSGGGSGDQDHFNHFENFSGGAPRRDVEAGVAEAFHPESLPSSQVEPQFRNAAEKMQPNERSEIAQDLMDELKSKGLAPSWLQRMLGLGTADPAKASPDDVAKLTEYSRQNHPEVFQRVMADKPFLVRWLDKPLVAGLVGIIAGKLLARQFKS